METKIETNEKHIKTTRIDNQEDGKLTSSTILQTKDGINFQIKKGVEKECLVNRKKRKSY